MSMPSFLAGSFFGFVACMVIVCLVVDWRADERNAK